MARGRAPGLKVATTESTISAADLNKESEKVSDEDESNNDEKQVSETTTVSGLNRLKSRPRIQISKPSERPKAAPINRKPNPLLARRRLGALGVSTTAAPAEEPADKVEDDASEKESEEHEIDNDSSAAVTETAEPVTEAPRGLGLLGNRRRPLLRKPGTLLQSS